MVSAHERTASLPGSGEMSLTHQSVAHMQAARRIEITSSTKNAAKRADKLSKLKAGKAVGPKKDKKVKQVSGAPSLCIWLHAGCVSGGVLVSGGACMCVRARMFKGGNVYWCC